MRLDGMRIRSQVSEARPGHPGVFVVALKGDVHGRRIEWLYGGKTMKIRNWMALRDGGALMLGYGADERSAGFEARSRM